VTVSLEAVPGIPGVAEGADLGALVAGAAALNTGDVVVIAQKVVSKAEGRVRRLADVEAGPEAVSLAHRLGHDPRLVQLILDESVRIVRAERVLIVETRHGFVCANAGIDHSNVDEEDAVTLLPLDCDASAAGIRARIGALTSKDVGVVVSDTFGRPWRIGQCNVALGVAGIPPCADLRGGVDMQGRPLEATVIATADEIASAAGLLMHKRSATPVVVVRGLSLSGSAGTGRDLLRPAALDLFR